MLSLYAMPHGAALRGVVVSFIRIVIVTWGGLP